MAQNANLPQDHRALVVTSTSEVPAIQNLPTPKPTPGSAIARILATNVLSYSRDIYNGKRQYPFPTPLVPGSSAVGRIAAVGPDAALLKPGDLVLIDCYIRGRDDPTATFLSGISQGLSEGSKKLMAGEWRNSTYAEYAKVPMESCTILDEKRFCTDRSHGGLGYSIEELASISTPMVPYGGLKDIDLQAGESVVIAPATGNFGHAAIRVALAMGAKVIAMGRNQTMLDKLTQLNPARVTTVPITGNMEADAHSLKSHGPIDVYFDISPPVAAQSTHLKSCILAIRHSGRISLMGGIRADVGFPYQWIMRNNITLKGKWMYERSDITSLVKMVEVGLFDLARGEEVKAFGLDDWERAFTAAAEESIGHSVVLSP
ncbi:hypothetical protein ACLMJK_001542 [Lecanora helva]